MRISLRGGQILLLPDGASEPFSSENGYFILDGRPCADPDLSLTPALYVTCDDRESVYALYQWEFVLGRPEDIE